MNSAFSSTLNIFSCLVTVFLGSRDPIGKNKTKETEPTCFYFKNFMTEIVVIGRLD